MDTDTTLHTVEPTELAIHQAPAFTVDAEDIDIPRINLIQKTSEIQGPTGAVMLDKKYLLLEAGESANVVVFAAVKGWREDIPFDDDAVPKMAFNHADRDRLAAESQYDMLEFAEITLIFEQPEGSQDEEAYPFPIGDKQYAIGKINVARDAYRQTYKRLATFAAFNKSVKPQERYWSFSSSLMTKGRYSWYAPSLNITQEVPPQELLDFVNSFSL